MSSMDSVYKMDSKGIYAREKSRPLDANKHIAILFPDGSYLLLERKPGTMFLEIKQSKLLFVNTDYGAWEVDTVTQKCSHLYLEGKAVSHTVRDNENNIWFATLGGGIYKLISKEFINYQFSGLKEPEIHSLEKWNNWIVGGTNYRTLYGIQGSQIHPIRINHDATWVNHPVGRYRVHPIKKLSSGDLVAGVEPEMLILSSEEKIKARRQMTPLKSI